MAYVPSSRECGTDSPSVPILHRYYVDTRVSPMQPPQTATLVSVAAALLVSNLRKTPRLVQVLALVIKARIVAVALR